MAPEPVGAAQLERFVDLLTQTRPRLVVDRSPLARVQYAHDASSYRVRPLAVVAPRTADEVVDVVRAAAEAGIPVTPRGTGTSMAGNAVGPGVLVDLARYMNRVHGVDPVAGTADVEAGVVLDALQAQAAAYGLMFGPDPSSHSRVSVGGMVGNDACGNHSVAHGRTSDHLVALEVVLADGTRAWADAGGLHALRLEDEPHVQRLEQGLRDVIGRHLATLRTELGQVPRQVSGYHLHRLLPENRFDVARALAGSEGTLAVVTRAVLGLVPRPTSTTMLVLGYDDLVDAAEDVPSILRFAPSAVEAIDDAIVSALRSRGANLPVLPAARAWLYVELDGDDGPARGARMASALHTERRLRDSRVVDDAAERAALWRVREDGAGLVANLPGARRAWAGWEDAAVHPDQLAGYLRGFRLLLAEHGYTGVLYGHFGAGCVHVRIDFDFSTEAERARMANFIRAAARLVASHGGTVSGEHGDGRARSAVLHEMYSLDALRAFADIKAVLDPGGVLNPGVIVDPAPTSTDLAAPGPTSPTTLVLHHGDDLTTAAGRCVGIGRCVAPTGGVMCPSYRATRDERDSTRGRARALQAMLSGQGGLSEHDVLDTLDLCLSCKACAADCPTGVDMASYKSEVLHRHYRRRLRPRTHYTLGWLPLTARVASPVAGLMNALMRGPTRRPLLVASGITTKRSVPRIATMSERRRALASVDRPEPRALLLVDTFTRAFRPDLAAAASRVLADAGIAVAQAPSVCCGLTWTTTGQLGMARRTMRRTMQRLSDPAINGLPVVVLEPSCAAAITTAQELVPTPQARQLASRVLTFEAALRTLARPAWRPPTLGSSGVLQTHCHEYSVLTDSAQAVTLHAAGMVDLDEAVGCCGLAGNFGFEAQHYETSLAVANTALVPALRRAPDDAVLVADGFSCRTQIDHLVTDGRRARHLAEVLDDALTTSREAHR